MKGDLPMKRFIFWVGLVLLIPALVVLPSNTHGQSGLQFDFAQVAGNPIIPEGDFGTWDHGGNYGQSFVEYEGTYYLFYTGISGRGVNPTLTIGYATSQDGQTWEKAPANPVIKRADGVTLAGPVAVTVDAEGKWTLLFGTVSQQNLLPQSDVWRATAPNPNGPWAVDAAPVMDFSQRDWDRIVYARGLVQVEGEFRFYYIGMTRRYQSPQLGLATSPDGITWELRADPLLAGDEKGWDFMGVGFSNPIQTARGWEAFYVGYTVAPTIRAGQQPATLWLGYATSPDGITWTKQAGNPIVDTGANAPPLINIGLIDGVYFIYYDYRVQTSSNGMGLITGTIQE